MCATPKGSWTCWASPAYADERAGVLSGGTRQKLNVTLALMHDPQVLLLDEPYQGFDWDTYQRFWDLAARLRDAGRSGLVVSHLAYDTERLDELWRLDSGMPRADRRGPPREVSPDPLRCRHPVHPPGARRNRFAMVLVILFVPVWTTLAYLAMPETPARMRLRATGEALTPHGNELTAISCALNAVTLITGFMMFAATFSGSGFDRRLAMAGYPRAHLVLAKVTALALVSAAVAAYATAITCLACPPGQPLLLAASLFCAGLT
ncbi:ABC transporter family protein [Streptomyces sp. SLBN-31]|nr:ABC transporter family protein [Streptomyces sp. SLBN-31]